MGVRQRDLEDLLCTIRIPVGVVAKRNEVVSVDRELAQVLRRHPTPAEIAGEMGCAAREVFDVLRATAFPISLDKPVGENGTGRLGDLVEDRLAECPFEGICGGPARLSRPVQARDTGGAVRGHRGERLDERVYAGAQHEIFNETNKDEVLADVTGFVDRVLRDAP